MGHTGRQSRIDDRLAVDHGLLLHNTECFAVCRGGQHKDVTVRKGCPQIGFFQIPEEMHLCRHVGGFCDLVQLFFHFRRAVPHEEQLAALHLCKRMQQHLDAFIVDEPSHKQHPHRFRILLDLPQNGLAFHTAVRLHIDAIGNDTALVRELGQKRRTGNVSLRCRNDAVCTAEKPHQQRLIEPEQRFLPHHIAVPCDHNTAAIARQQTRQICQRKRHVEFHHVCPLRQLPELPQKRKGNGTGKVCAQAGRIVHRNTLYNAILAPALFLTNQHLHFRTLLQFSGKCPHQTFNSADMGIICFIYLQNPQFSLLTHGKPPDTPRTAVPQNAPT